MYKVGDTALVTKGPFEGNEGVITDVNDKKGIVKLNINLLGRDTPIELEFGGIKVNK
jgi:transcriptional antiterminator NusG